MEDIQHCCVCLEHYNAQGRKPLLLPCRHTLCSSCVDTKAISACPLCRQELNLMELPLPVHEQLLNALRNKMPSPSSFPIGLMDDSQADEAPGTPPYPSAPALVEIQPCDTDFEGSSRRATGSFMHHSRRSNSSSGSSSMDLAHFSSSRLSARQGGQHSSSSTPATSAGKSGSASPAGSPTGTVAARAIVPRVGAPGCASQSTSAAAGSCRAKPPLPSSYSGLGSAGGHGAAASTRGLTDFPSGASSTSSQQVLLSFPVEDLDPDQDEYDGLDAEPGSPRDWRGSEDDPNGPAAAAGAGGIDSGACTHGSRNTQRGSDSSRVGGGRRSVYVSLGALHAVASSAVCLLQQLAVPWGGLLDHEGRQAHHHQQQRGVSADCLLPTSVVAATVHSSVYCWVSYTAAVRSSLRSCRAAQQHTQATMERALRRIGMPGYGQLAWYWMATWVLGFLLYHWQLGLQLLPIATASLALSAVWRMQPMSDGVGSSSSRTDSSNSNSRGAGSGVGGGTSSSNSSSGMSGGLPVWPSQAAGGLLAADCCLLAVLSCTSQQTGHGYGTLLALLAATPQVLAVVLLLLWGQVVLDVLVQGWWGHRQLRHASLLCRCWLVAAAGVLSMGASSGSLSGTLSAAATWVQKAHMLLIEGPVLVLYLGMLVRPLQELSQLPSRRQQQQQHGAATAAAGPSCSRGSASRSRPTGASESTPAGGAAGTSSASALLVCLHFLLQLLVLLFVPPMPLAAAAWLPQPLQGALVWGARVLLCGIAMQLMLMSLNGPEASPPSGATVATWQHGVGTNGGRGSLQYGLSRGDSCALAAAAGPAMLSMAHSSTALGSSCCSSPSPRARCGWELQLHGSSSVQTHVAVCGDGSREHSSWGLMAASSYHYGVSTGRPAGVLGAFGGNDGSSMSPVTAGVYCLLWQHAPYLLLLLAAFAGDTFITAAAPSVLTSAGTAAAAGGGAAAGWAVRLAWQRCLQCCMVVGLCVEAALAARRELLMLLRLPLFPGGNANSSGGSSWSWRPITAAG